MDEALTKLVENAPASAAILIAVYMMLRHFGTQKAECHQWQEAMYARYEVTSNRLDMTLAKTNECLTQCAAAHARQEKVFRRMMHDASEDGEVA